MDFARTDPDLAESRIRPHFSTCSPWSTSCTAIEDGGGEAKHLAAAIQERAAPAGRTIASLPLAVTTP